MSEDLDGRRWKRFLRVEFRLQDQEALAGLYRLWLNLGRHPLRIYLCCIELMGVRSSYGIWLSGENFPEADGGYANLTNWFEVVDEGEDGRIDATWSIGWWLARWVEGLRYAAQTWLSIGVAAVAIALYRWVRRSRRVQSDTPDARDAKSVDSIVDDKTIMPFKKEEVLSV